MKKRNWKNIVTVITSLVCIMMVQVPWFIVNGKRYNLYTAYFYLKKTGVSGVSEEIHLENGEIIRVSREQIQEVKKKITEYWRNAK